MTDRIEKSPYFSFPSRLMLLTCLALVIPGCNWIEILSGNSNGEQGDSSSAAAGLSHDARYMVFSSYASNIVPDDFNERSDVFVRDTVNGTTIRVSVDSAGNESTENSSHGAISADGRYVVFESFNLRPNDPDGFGVYVHDTVTRVTSRVDVDSEGNPGDSVFSGSDSYPDISADGRFIAFSSGANNLVPDDTNSSAEVFVHDRITGVSTIVSVDSSGNQASSGFSSVDPDISSDGRYVAFTSSSSTLAPGDNNSSTEFDKNDVFVHDRQTGETRRVSVNSAGVGWKAASNQPSISDDGRFVAYSSWSNLPPWPIGQCCPRSVIYVHDLTTGSTDLVSSPSYNGPGSSDSERPYISASGRYVTFQSEDPDTVPGDTNGDRDAFVYDRVEGTTRRVSVGVFGEQGNDISYSGPISADERYISFSSRASNLTDGDTNGYQDAFLRAMPEVTITSIIPDHLPIGATTAVAITGTNFLPGSTLAVGGAQKSNIVIVDENTITLDVTIPTGTEAGARTLAVFVLGTAALDHGASGICQDCLTFF